MSRFLSDNIILNKRENIELQKKDISMLYIKASKLTCYIYVTAESNTGLIVGAVVGGVGVLIVIILVLVYFLILRRKSGGESCKFTTLLDLTIKFF